MTPPEKRAFPSFAVGPEVCVVCVVYENVCVCVLAEVDGD